MSEEIIELMRGLRDGLPLWAVWDSKQLALVPGESMGEWEGRWSWSVGANSEAH